LLQGRRLALPRYVLAGTAGQAHVQCFNVLCEIDALRIRTEGSGASRRAAEQMAAQRALERLQES
jgi:ribonuclease-3